jgi:putative ABC transport system permease protein
MSVAVSDRRAVLAGALVANRLRTVVATLAIAVGVALGYAVHLVNRAALDELTHGVRMLSGDADLTVRGPRGGFDEAVFVALARDRDVAAASPVVEADVRVQGSSERLRVLGIDPFRAGAIQPALVGESKDSLDTLRPATLFLSNAAMKAFGVAPGDTLLLQAGLREVTVKVAGSIAGALRERVATMDIAAAQDAFDTGGRLSRVDLRLRPGASPRAFVDRVATSLPAGVAIDRPDASLRATESISRSYRVNLNVLALVALFTGGLLVFSTQALGVVRRRAHFALLRTLGMTRARLAALVALEGALVGIAGSALGIAAGYGIALAAVRVAGADLGSGYFRGVDASVGVDPPMLAAFFALGVLAAVLGSALPAREAARAPPALALKAGDEERAFAAMRPPHAGLASIGIGAALLALPPIGGLPLAGYAAIACLLIGTLLLLPTLAAALLARWPIPASAPRALALAQLRGAIGQSSVSLVSIVASVSLMVSMAIMVASFRQSLDDWLVRVLPADLYVRAPSTEGAALARDAQDAIAKADGVERVEFVRESHLLIDAARPRIVLIARPIDERDAASRLPLVAAPVARPADAPPAVWVNEAMVDLYGFAPGGVVTLPIAGRSVHLFVAGVWRDYGRPQGAVQIDRSVYASIAADASATGAAVWLRDGVDAAAVRASIQRAIPGGEQLEIASPGEIRALSLAAFDRTFAVTYALEIAAVAIGLAGLSSAFGALVLGRRREFGVLRHLGMTRRQVATMLASEGFATATIGVGVGLGLGAVVSLVLIHVVNRQSFHWGMELFVPWLDLAALAVIVVALATLTAVTSGRQAMGGDVVRAVREDW